MPELVLVSDFDGTITATDFYELAVRELLTPADIKPWEDYRAGKITHFTALQQIFSNIQAPEEKVLAMLEGMNIDPRLAESVNALRDRGWTVVIASAGCLWYIHILLKKAGVSLEVHSNPGTYPQGGPLLLELPKNDPFFCPETGIDKAAIVRHHLSQGATVAFAGDGYTDLPPALLVQPQLRFARNSLAGALAERGESFQPFTAWSDIARSLLAQGDLA
jgi:2,3-diketo-5-methylthio-1-phosphopentane phosphatase